MNSRTRTTNLQHSSKPPHFHNKKMEVQKAKVAEKAATNRRRSRRERKIALLQDVDKLKKKLRQEEDVHRALERAFSRPLGALPRFPPHLPPHTLELLAEVAVLEEEVVRLEEEVVSFRQRLYQEAVYLSSRITSGNSISSNDLKKQGSVSFLPLKQVGCGPPPKLQPLNYLSRSASCRSISYSDRGKDYSTCIANSKKASKELNSPVEDGPGKENRLVSNTNKAENIDPLEEETPALRRSGKRAPNKPSVIENYYSSRQQNSSVDRERMLESCSTSSDDRVLEAESEANKISEDALKCLFDIFLRLSKLKGKTMDSIAFSSLVSLAFNGNNQETQFRDPYGICSKSKKRDIGPYKHLFAIEAGSIDLKRRTNASFLIRRLKFLLAKLACVNLERLTHQQKLAFWINAYNICMMNAILEHGIPERPEMVVALMQKAKLAAGGHLLDAVTIEHFILRRPSDLKLSCSKSPKNDEIEVWRKFSLEWSEPLVTFALCCGSWSSPAVRVYTALQVENELEAAKKDYLQAAISISAANKLILPKILDWYLLDFAKNLDSLLDWVCLQLPDKLRNAAVRCLEKKGRVPVSQLVQVMPYDLRFRYLIDR